MIDRINALGQFLVNQTGKTFNFKSIKSDHMYPGILFSFAGEDYLVTPDKAELDLTIALMASRTPLRTILQSMPENILTENLKK